MGIRAPRPRPGSERRREEQERNRRPARRHAEELRWPTEATTVRVRVRTTTGIWIWTARWLRRLPTARTIWIWTTTRLWPTTAGLRSGSTTARRPDRTRWSVGKLLNHSSCDVIIP